MTMDVEMQGDDAQRVLQYGDFVILYGSHDHLYSVTLENHAITNNKFGNFHHEDIVGKRFGTQIPCRSESGFVYVLKQYL